MRTENPQIPVNLARRIRVQGCIERSFQLTLSIFQVPINLVNFFMAFQLLHFNFSIRRMVADELIDAIRARRPYDERAITSLCHIAEDILFQEGTLISLPVPVNICGDVHGQLHDLFHLFEVGGPPETTRYLFLGDYVDRGYCSIDTFILLLAYKVRYPNSFYLLRGNHESRSVNQIYGFYEEVIQRFGHAGPWKLCNEVFDMLPMAALFSHKIYCVHGGLSPSIKLCDQVALFERRAEIPTSGPLSDLCWSDPEEIAGWGMNQRGAGWLFGPRPAQEFCHNNGLKYICRAHQLAMQGFQWHFSEKQVVTVWSAPNYMYRSGNKASIMKVNDALDAEFDVFEAVAGQDGTESDTVPPYFA
jgi:diadenosine tetraphosphatase ApaH/serine/threonine PP2A family protein phosphatase